MVWFGYYSKVVQNNEVVIPCVLTWVGYWQKSMENNALVISQMVVCDDMNWKAMQTWNNRIYTGQRQVTVYLA